jgi:osmotically-inducible protein OsmY
VYLSVKKDDLKALPEERPDPILVIEVKRTLQEERFLHGAEIENILVSATRGFITLSGYVPDSVQKARAEKAARRIPGVLNVENRLVLDEDLKLAAAEAVAQIPGSSAGSVFVGAQNGYIVLTGEAPSVESRLAAEERAGSVPKIRGVLNWIRVEGLEYSEPRAIQPRIGARVYGRNVVSAHVEQVIVNRVNRLVEAIVVDGLCPEPRKDKTHWFLGDSALVRRKVVIPILNIDHQTRTAVFLANEVPRFADLDRISFVLPEAGWRPPYPYHRENVLVSKPVESGQGNPQIVGVTRDRKAIA